MLRALEDKVIERVGGSKTIPVDIRIIAATHRDLDEMIRSNRFREDLLFRINVFPIRVPPLRNRKEDIPSLVHYFIRKKTRELKAGAIPELAPGAIDRLIAYEWPGNVRELENVIEREMILYKDAPLRFDAVAAREIRAAALPGPATGSPDGMEEPFTLEEVDRRHILSVLKTTTAGSTARTAPPRYWALMRARSGAE